MAWWWAARRWTRGRYSWRRRKAASWAAPWASCTARSAGIPVIAAIGGQYGCFGGMGIAIACCDAIVMSEEGRLGLSGPEVIETAHGVEEFDSRDRALVWRTLGGKHRYLTGDCDV